MRALVTGGTHGIGGGIALELLRRASNNTVIVTGRTVEKFNAFAATLTPEELSRVTFVQGDMCSAWSIQRIADILKEWGGVDYLVNNVGGGGRWGTDDVVETEWSVWDQVFSLNVVTAIELVRTVLPYMEAQEFGRIISIASIYGKEAPAGGRPWFVMSKASLISLMKSLSKNKQYTDNNITFNTISPGPLAIPDTGWDKMDPIERSDFIVQNIPVGFIGGVEDVVRAFSFIVASSYVNGANIVVDGGMSNSY